MKLFHSILVLGASLYPQVYGESGVHTNDIGYGPSSPVPTAATSPAGVPADVLGDGDNAALNAYCLHSGCYTSTILITRTFTLPTISKVSWPTKWPHPTKWPYPTKWPWPTDWPTKWPEDPKTVTETVTETITVPGPPTTITVRVTETITVPYTTTVITTVVSTDIRTTVIEETEFTTVTVTDEETVTLPPTTIIDEETVTLPPTTIIDEETVTLPPETIVTTLPPVTTTIIITLPPVTSVVTTTLPASTITLPGSVTTLPAETITITTTLPASTVTETTTIPGKVTTIIQTVPATRTLTGTDRTVTRTVTQISVCPSRTVNPTFTPRQPLPSNYLWGCPPGSLCRPNRTPEDGDCNFEVGPPSLNFFCSLDECKAIPPLHPPQFWGPPVVGDRVEKFIISPGYYNLDPRKFGLDFDIFVHANSSDSLDLRKRQSNEPVPAVCYEDCNNCALEGERKNLSPELCESGSIFLNFLEHAKLVLIVIITWAGYI
ncbi:predicted protein [Uncinocarpus reesii 1704]|uniref:Uncharacterized protein n=1 Tax=Uncinocarpus reesii (strain UAMH 1704) TaxID=336963 RepID=C4JIU0_UNCRE|nr:uncharacterized protein UREG_02951 [Uncinocarpus reesii 1704]EEP78102.1 predicted protein [Uncinocarpus reesii 1704]